MYRAGFLCAVVFALVALPVVAAQNIAPSAPGQNALASSASQNSGDAQHGHQLFLADGCSQCHGTVGEGGAAGPRIAPNPMETDAIARYIRDPHGEMPPYSATVLDDRGVQDIQAYLATLPQPPTLTSIPTLNQQ
jgi:mono/diheme cytochrome c family protein